MTMEAGARKVEQLLHSRDQYIIPVFQRYYSWNKKDWDQLLNDVYDILGAQDSKRHFLGCIVCVPAKHEPGLLSGYLVIDGQQRLTTLSILLCVVRDLAKEKGWSVADEITENFLVHKFKKNFERYKIFPRLKDREVYFSLVEGTDVSRFSESQVHKAYAHFRNQLTSNKLSAAQDSLEQIFSAIANGLELVTITLTDENPYKIFKSLNSTGVDLQQGDLIRNLVFMSVPVSDQDEFDETSWRKLEKHFERNNSLDGDLFSNFFRDVLMRAGKSVTENAVYEEFEKQYNLAPNAQQKVDELLTLGNYYDFLLGSRHHSDFEVEYALSLIRDLKVTTSFPLILKLFELRHAEAILDKHLAIALRSISGFVLRRSVCGLSSSSYARWFGEICSKLNILEANANSTDVLDAIKDVLEAKGWPTDQHFEEHFLTMNLYEKKYCRTVLMSLELALQAASEPVSLEGCSIEHILPQNIDDGIMGGRWKEMLGLDWLQIHDTWQHTPGNLTLLGADYNRELQNHSFDVKLPSLQNSRVYLNNHFRVGVDNWGVTEIKARASDLCNVAKRIWIASKSCGS